jgi:hypothetical protein
LVKTFDNGLCAENQHIRCSIIILKKVRLDKDPYPNMGFAYYLRRKRQILYQKPEIESRATGDQPNGIIYHSKSEW